MDAHAWDERYAAAAQVWSTTPNQFVEAALRDLPPGDALDLAAGEGRNAIWLAARGWRVTAADFSAVAVDRGRRLAGDLAIEWRVGDVLVADLPAVDLVVVAYLHLAADERTAVVRRAWSVLRPSGTFFLVAHDLTNLTEGTGGPQDASVLSTAGDVVGDLADEPGVEVVRAERVARLVTADDAHGGEEQHTAWDHVVHLRRS
ncbi:class I SAM-dependent methyltransferase [Nocardioides sp. HDW12B]|uniref:class I SAM-dependent methyltransferase n=1 Tax=Nocardioides sp. HDW12B TaxID=2714939 RepID=UPI00140BD486|nr:class I SAM-dependent methyltransferase [Nocardioides sp. HDW12B]QIK67511.1 class I SAM-dependent methyltransferase [Nocardioides sp. HDW12B]